MIQHDCGHGAFFSRRWANDWTGRVIGVFTLTPYDFWRRNHAIHHATTGNLDRRGIGDVDTLTVREYRARSRWGRLAYRLYRHPLVMFGVGPAYLFFLQQRLPVGLMRGGWRPWASTMAHQSRDRAHRRRTRLADRHQGVPARSRSRSCCSRPRLAFGCSMSSTSLSTRLGRPRRSGICTRRRCTAVRITICPRSLRWFTANIGVHHVHHLCSRIPYYRLPQVLRDHPELREIGRLTLLESFRCVRLALWDETQRRLISFRDVRARG